MSDIRLLADSLKIAEYTCHMNKPRLYVTAGLAILLVAGFGYALMSQRPVAQLPAPSNTATNNVYTQADVSSHNTAASCWSSIEGGVYDLTGWINRHPGGAQAIISLCGTDGTASFVAQHGSSRSPRRELVLLKIGNLQ